MTNEKQLDIYIDESGDFSMFSKKNPFYSVAFVMVESSFDNSASINKYQSNLQNLLGGIKNLKNNYLKTLIDKYR